MRCKNCNHGIVLVDKGYKHKNEKFDSYAKKYYNLCGARITSAKKLANFRERYRSKYNEEYTGRNPFCGCKKAEPKI